MLIGLAVLLLLMVVVCCGGGYWFLSHSKPVEEPAAVKALTSQIVDITIPAPLEPLAGMDVKIPVVNKTMVRFVIFADKSQESRLVLFAMGEMFAGQNQEEIQRAINDSLKQQKGKQQDTEALENAKETTKKVTIRGQETEFKITTGTGVKTRQPRIEVKGTFQGKTGAVMLLLNANADRVSEAEIMKMLESIR